jgi:hypothetical protein
MKLLLENWNEFLIESEVVYWHVTSHKNAQNILKEGGFYGDNDVFAFVGNSENIDPLTFDPEHSFIDFILEYLFELIQSRGLWPEKMSVIEFKTDEQPEIKKGGKIVVWRKKDTPTPIPITEGRIIKTVHAFKKPGYFHPNSPFKE